MTPLERVNDFLSVKRIAIVGVSRQEKDFSRAVLREFRRRGYDVAPVNPAAREIDGIPCFARLSEVTPPVEGVMVMTPAGITGSVVRECAASGIPRVWLFRAGGVGAVDPEAVRFCGEQGISVIPGECPLMFLPEGAWFHRVHALIRKITRSYPS